MFVHDVGSQFNIIYDLGHLKTSSQPSLEDWLIFSDANYPTISFQHSIKLLMHMIIQIQHLQMLPMNCLLHPLQSSLLGHKILTALSQKGWQSSQAFGV